MRGDEVDDAGTAARPIKPPLEQHVWNSICFHRRCRVLIDLSLKHLASPFLILRRPVAERGPCPPSETSRYSPRRLPACWNHHDRSNLKGSLNIAMNRK